MNYNPYIHHRESIRLKDYDYSKEGMYFITICTQNRECLFGNIVDGKIIKNELTEIVEAEILKTNEIRKNVKINEYVVMPNHLHFILEIVEIEVINEGFPSGKPLHQTNNNGIVGVLPLARPNRLKPNTIGSIVNQIKGRVTKEARKTNNIYSIWQRNYYENIIRNEEIHQKIIDYIKNNPLKWQDDKYYVKR